MSNQISTELSGLIRDELAAESVSAVKIIDALLQEAHAIHIRLARRADHRDSGQLRRHHRQADQPPRQAA